MNKFFVVKEILPAYEVKGETVPAREVSIGYGFLPRKQLVAQTYRDAVKVEFKGKSVEITGAQREESASHVNSLKRAARRNELETKAAIVYAPDMADILAKEGKFPSEGLFPLLDRGHTTQAEREVLSEGKEPKEWLKAFGDTLVPVQVYLDGIDAYEAFHRHNQAKKATKCFASLMQAEDSDERVEYAECFNRAGLLKGLVVKGDTAGKGIKYSSMIERNALSSVNVTLDICKKKKISKTALEVIIKQVNDSVEIDSTNTAGRTLFIAAVNVALLGLMSDIPVETTVAKFTAADWKKIPAGTSAQGKREACLWLMKAAFNGKHMEIIEAGVDAKMVTLGAFGIKAE